MTQPVMEVLSGGRLRRRDARSPNGCAQARSRPRSRQALSPLQGRRWWLVARNVAACRGPCPSGDQV